LLAVVIEQSFKMKTIGNVYVISSIAIIGGGLFGFDISSMSAIIGTEAYKCYFNQGDVACTGPVSCLASTY
jgi:hypothetical protein